VAAYGLYAIDPALHSLSPRQLSVDPRSRSVPRAQTSLASRRRSSIANSLCGRNSAGSPEICATFQGPQRHGARWRRAISRHNDSAGSASRDQARWHRNRCDSRGAKAAGVGCCTAGANPRLSLIGILRDRVLLPSRAGAGRHGSRGISRNSRINPMQSAAAKLPADQWFLTRAFVARINREISRRRAMASAV
jgi:hypothetical protein